MTHEFDALGWILYDVCCDRWVVGNLLDEEIRPSAPIGVGPVAVEQSVPLISLVSRGGLFDLLSKNRVERPGKCDMRWEL